MSTKQHVYLRHRKADLLLVKLICAHNLLDTNSCARLSRAHVIVSRAHNIKYFIYMSL